jgi:type II secretory pathway pseudopilin PulG
MTRRGALLLETILALAVFILAGTAILSLLRTAAAGLVSAREVEQAADLARSAMAKIEAGLATPLTLNGPVRSWLEEDAERGERHEGLSTRPEPAASWELDIQTTPSQFRGLTRVSITAMKHGGGSGQPAASYTLHQLVRLGGKGEDRAGDEDPLVEIARRGAAERPAPARQSPPQEPRR